MTERFPQGKTYSPWFLRLDHLAAPVSPAQAVEYLQHHADRLGITLLGSVNGREFVAVPDLGPPSEVPPTNPKETKTP